ncbi:hypothetical protein AVEN_121548-1 [Araneus ventricosus]|uniref:Uncharacterized protein n=1 Tax=Araneus ventricosus TaxID=182803 RepID=A0A4Y2GMB1_ARAVE|nr:hypothetical protein AVEN_121548-1 [Araneus ventricosus]
MAGRRLHKLPLMMGRALNPIPRRHLPSTDTGHLTNITAFISKSDDGEKHGLGRRLQAFTDDDGEGIKILLYPRAYLACTAIRQILMRLYHKITMRGRKNPGQGAVGLKPLMSDGEALNLVIPQAPLTLCYD